MRIWFWILLVALITFSSSANAASAVVDSEDTDVSQLTLTNFFTVGNSDVAKRFLRGKTEKELTTGDDDLEVMNAGNEERGIIPSSAMAKVVPSSVKSMVSKVKNAWAKWEDMLMQKAVRHMIKNGETPDMLAKRLNIGGATERRYKRLHDYYSGVMNRAG
ncbi:Avirulence protein (Avh) [Phytophthora palmivora]|uniref:RxLR effector protein n=1 Tax=Phytophthora palmivora TaxID=4796 RepID=A0A2P4YKJ6_9STRA|nr:Avirulence protein (Avh) [Phytophthora palmivora]